MSKYRLWGRKLADPDALWFDLPHRPMYRDQAEHLIDYYSETWGSMYEYEVHLVGFYPQGTREPCFAGIND